MKNRFKEALSLSFLLTLLGTLAWVYAGSLTPPAGPVSSTMKTLVDVEPRTPVQSLPGDANALHIISQPGSYYLTGNITGEASKDGILITANNVTLDLMGYTLDGGTVGLDAIEFAGTGRTNLVLRNGIIQQ